MRYAKRPRMRGGTLGLQAARDGQRAVGAAVAEKDVARHEGGAVTDECFEEVVLIQHPRHRASRIGVPVQAVRSAPPCSAACAAASRATGTRYGLQET